MIQEKDKSVGLNAYEELRLKVLSLYKNYSYLNLTIEQFEKVCKNVIIEIHKKDAEVDQYQELQILQTSLEEYIKKELSNNEKAKIILRNFIDEKIKAYEDFEKNLDQLKKVNKFLTKYSVEQNPELYSDLLGIETINKIIRNIVENNIEIIRTAGIEYVESNHNIQLLIEMYCEINNIEFQKPKEENFLEEYSIELKTTDSLGLYLRQIAKPLLTKEEETRLFELKEQGDDEATKKLIEHNLQLVVYVAKNFIGKGMEFLDIIQEGNIGLATAIEKFDYKKGYKLSTYATWWIRQSIQRSLMNNSRPIRLPVHMCERLQKYGVTLYSLEKKLSRKPTKEEICEEMKITMEQLAEIEKANQNIVSLNSLVNPDGSGDTELGDLIASEEDTLEEQYLQNYMSEEIELILNKIRLSERERFVILSRSGFGDGKPKTLEAVAKALGLTRERVRQIEQKALRKIRISPYIKRLAILADIPIENNGYTRAYYSRYDQYTNQKRKIFNK